MKTQKHLKLYIALFCLSMLISASVAVVHADSTQTTTLTYTIPSISYEVNIPATLSLNDTSTLNFSLTPESQLNDCYAVLVQVDQTSFSVTSSDKETGDKYPYIILYENGVSGSSYKRAYTLTNYEGKSLYTYETKTNGYDIAARLYDQNSQSYSSEGGITFNYVPGHSRMSSDTSITYSGKIKFKISGYYY